MGIRHLEAVHITRVWNQEDRCIAKLVDEMRVKTNAKVTYGGVVLGAKRDVQNRGIEGKVEKYRPDLPCILTAPISGTPQHAAEMRPTTRIEEILRPESRTAMTLENYFGLGNA